MTTTIELLEAIDTCLAHFEEQKYSFIRTELKSCIVGFTGEGLDRRYIGISVMSILETNVGVTHTIGGPVKVVMDEENMAIQLLLVLQSLAIRHSEGGPLLQLPASQILEVLESYIEE